MIFSGLEWVAGYLIQGENIYKNVGMMDGNHPLMGFDDDLGYQIRKQAMAKLTYTFPVIIEKQKIARGSYCASCGILLSCTFISAFHFFKNRIVFKK
jgi:hypothetical protein